MANEEKELTDEQLMKEMIKKVDKKKIRKIMAMSLMEKDSEFIGIDLMLEEWARQKLRFYKLMGRNIKLKQEINFNKEDIEKSKMTNDEKIMSTNITDIFKCTDSKFPFFQPITNEMFIYSRLEETLPMISREALSSHTYRDLFDAKYRNQSISFSKFIHDTFQSPKLDEVISKYIEENFESRVHGFVYLSIDPIDYLTMSMNLEGWNSCQSLHMRMNIDEVEIGSYGSATISYICDNSTMIAYRTDGEEKRMAFNNRSVMIESKKWRQLIYMNQDFSGFFNSRQYPYPSELLCKTIRNMIEKLIDKTNDVKEHTYTGGTLENSNAWQVDYLRRFNNLTGSIRYLDADWLQYDDVHHEWKHTYTFKYNEKETYKSRIAIGSHPFCPKCGKYRVTSSSGITCTYCRTGDMPYYIRDAVAQGYINSEENLKKLENIKRKKAENREEKKVEKIIPPISSTPRVVIDGVILSDVWERGSEYESN